MDSKDETSDTLNRTCGALQRLKLKASDNKCTYIAAYSVFPYMVRSEYEIAVYT